MWKMVMIASIGVLAALPAGAVGTADTTPPLSKRLPDSQVIAQRSSCKAASTCREAVEMWCGGYRRADADDDGIPCENVCRSKSQVDAIKDEIGC
jgi:hypothetical protein